MLAAFSLVPSAIVARDISVAKLAAIVFSDPVALVTSAAMFALAVAKFVVKVPSAAVALVTSAANADELVLATPST